MNKETIKVGDRVRSKVNYFDVSIGDIGTVIKVGPPDTWVDAMFPTDTEEKSKLISSEYEKVEEKEFKEKEFKECPFCGGELDDGMFYDRKIKRCMKCASMVTPTIEGIKYYEKRSHSPASVNGDGEKVGDCDYCKYDGALNCSILGCDCGSEWKPKEIINE